MSDQVVETLAWCFVLALLINAVSVYAVVKLLTTGRAALLERKHDTSEHKLHLYGS